MYACIASMSLMDFLTPVGREDLYIELPEFTAEKHSNPALYGLDAVVHTSGTFTSPSTA